MEYSLSNIFWYLILIYIKLYPSKLIFNMFFQELPCTITIQIFCRHFIIDLFYFRFFFQECNLKLPLKIFKLGWGSERNHCQEGQDCVWSVNWLDHVTGKDTFRWFLIIYGEIYVTISCENDTFILVTFRCVFSAILWVHLN